jgi:methionyl-tRNA formyltransferase
MKIVFMGTPEFALPTLLYLIENEDVKAVFTQPDKPKGRKAVLTAPPVKEMALLHNIPVYQPHTLKDGEAQKIIEGYSPDLLVVIAYGKILPQSILNIPSHGAINIHASLLPKLRGAAPIQWSIINGDKKTGITTMQMDAGLDTGDILVQDECIIGENETSGELHNTLAELSAVTLKKTLEKIKNKTIERIKQDDTKHTLAPILSKSCSPIDFTQSAKQVHDKVRGLNPWPSACAVLCGKTVKIHKTTVAGETMKSPGTVYKDGCRIYVACGDGNAVEILEIHPEGSRKMTGAEFICGHNIN